MYNMARNTTAMLATEKKREMGFMPPPVLQFDRYVGIMKRCPTLKQVVSQGGLTVNSLPAYLSCSSH